MGVAGGTLPHLLYFDSYTGFKYLIVQPNKLVRIENNISSFNLTHKKIHEWVCQLYSLHWYLILDACRGTVLWVYALLMKTKALTFVILLKRIKIGNDTVSIKRRQEINSYPVKCCNMTVFMYHWRKSYPSNVRKTFFKGRGLKTDSFSVELME